MNQKIITAITGFSLMLLFAYTATGKLAGHALFLAQLAKFPWLSPMAGLISWAVPLVEVAVVVLLFFPATLKYGLYASFLLLMLFTVYLVLMVVFKTSLPCSCGGVISRLGWKQHIVFNCSFIALSAVAIRLHKQTKEQPITGLKSLLQ